MPAESAVGGGSALAAMETKCLISFRRGAAKTLFSAKKMDS